MKEREPASRIRQVQPIVQSRGVVAGLTPAFSIPVLEAVQESNALRSPFCNSHRNSEDVLVVASFVSSARADSLLVHPLTFRLATAYCVGAPSTFIIFFAQMR